jgi:asparagine synthase (glutamine-hydrolysing)
MCGLIAAFSNASISDNAIYAALLRMARRGPDGEGVWREAGTVLGHRRLAVLDLDPRAAQPMHSICGRYAIVFNGEIYNFHELRRELQARGETFRTTSDTEVILTLFAEQGEAMLPRLHGMFAFVIWDRVAKRGFAARDAYGIKPLYYAETTQGVLLGSQVKALLATGLVSREPDLQGQAGFWMLGSVPEPHTWYRDVRVLQAGHCIWIDGCKVSTTRCWSDITEAWHFAEPAQLPNQEVHERVRSALRESVARHLVADVPIGVFLSGGIDSGALAGLMVEAGARQLEGVTIAYDEFAGSHQDEWPIAARIAAHYGIRHHVRRVTREEFHADMPRILDAMDQPTIDGVNTWYASKAVAERGLKVVVSGVGGDELFQGYSMFSQLPRLVAARKAMAWIPGTTSLAQRAANWHARRTGIGRWRYAPAWTTSIAGAWWLRRSVHSPDELAGLMGAEAARESLQAFDAVQRVASMSGPLPTNQRLALGQIESTTYLRNQLLRDSDWASMDHSVELRTPLVDAHLLQQLQPFLPALAGFPNKLLLARAPTKPLPREVMQRPKTGFGIPVGRWLAEGPLYSSGVPSRGWARDLVGSYQATA